MTKKKLTADEWNKRRELEKQFIEEAAKVFEKYGIKEFDMRNDRYDYGCFLIWKNGLETSLSLLV